MQPYLIPAETISFSEEIKKSRFITFLAHAEGLEAAKVFIDETKKHHATARHHCWGYVAGTPQDSQQLGASDDGEPAGTAGKPILGHLLGSKLGEIVAVVVRYYGGVKLGTGGLVKAYGGGVQQALKQLPVREKILLKEYYLHCSYNQLSLVETLLQQSGGAILHGEYASEVSLRLALPAQEATSIITRLYSLSRGTLVVQQNL